MPAVDDERTIRDYAVATPEGAERGLVFGSGMGALTTAVRMHAYA